MQISKSKIEVPDSCPLNCSLYDIDYAMQGGWCYRCPILNCKPTPLPPEEQSFPGETFCLISAEDYREDWAKEWQKFFETGEKPILMLNGV